MSFFFVNLEVQFLSELGRLFHMRITTNDIIEFWMIEKWNIKIIIYSLSGVVRMGRLMRRQFVFEILIKIKGMCVESL